MPLRKYCRLKENIKLSEGISLSADLNTSDMCIYWGSTVALEALSLDIPLIHFDMQTPLSYDSLLDFDALKWQVLLNDQLEDTIEEIYALGQAIFLEKRREATTYLERYFYPVNGYELTKVF